MTRGEGVLRALACAFVCCCLSVSPARPETTPATPSNLHQWGAVTLFHGLPSNHVRAITQSPDGALWFGTDNGLARYDGRRVQKIGNAEFNSSRVSALELDEDGGIWVGTSAGAARVVEGAIQPIAPTRDKNITAIAIRGRGHAILASSAGELFDCQFPASGPMVIRAIGPDDHWLLRGNSKDETVGPPIEIASLALAGGDSLIVGTHSRGLLTVDLGGIESASRAPDFKEIKSAPRPFFINALAKDSQGRLWSGADAASGATGLYMAADLLRPEKVGAGTGAVTALRADESGNIWAGTEARGALVVREGKSIERFTFESTGGGLLSNRIHAVFIDREGVVWYGTDSGASRYDPRSPHVEAVSPVAESNFVRALLQSSDGALWSGTNRGLFVRAGGENSAWLEVAELRGRTVHALAEDGAGRILAGTASGLFVAQMEPGKAGPFVRLPKSEAVRDSIRAIHVRSGDVYIANYDAGVERLEVSPQAPGALARTLVSSAGHVSSLLGDGERLWIGTAEEGVYVFDGAQATTDPALQALVGSTVWSIAGSTKGALWFATAKGLYAWRAGALTLVLPGVDARSVAIARDESGGEQSVWCGTRGGGLYKAVLDGPEGAPLVSRIDSEQGLPSQSVFSVLAVPGGGAGETLWIGTSRGIARYEPGRVPPALNVTRVLGKRVYTPDEIRSGFELEYPQNSLAVEIAAASSRTFPEQFQYAFSLSDAEGRVIQRKLSRDSQLLIENLKPGHYKVEAGAFTRDLIPSQPARFEFSVAPAPFPWTSAALSVLLLLALVAMAWGYRQNSRLARANATLATTNVQLGETRFQLANETETERRRIARDLHDQTLADLRRLMMLTDRLPDAQTEFRREIESVSTEVRRICEDLSPSALANVGLAAALEWAVAEAAASQPDGAKFGYECSLEPALEETLSLDSATAIQVYRVVQEALSNVAKHAAASHVKLTMSRTQENALEITLEDNGRGFDIRKAGTSGRGLSNIRSRASLIDATVDWSARPGGGTLFTLRKPASTP